MPPLSLEKHSKPPSFTHLPTAFPFPLFALLSLSLSALPTIIPHPFLASPLLLMNELGREVGAGREEATPFSGGNRKGSHHLQGGAKKETLKRHRPRSKPACNTELINPNCILLCCIDYQ